MIRELGEGLVLREGSRADGDALVVWATEAFREPDGSVDEQLLPWVRDLTERDHPTFLPEYWRIVETADGRVASALCLIPQTWLFRGIEIPVGRVEIVATLPEYRRRGLVTALMGEIHALSAELGHLVQVIEGIPWFYRRYGYEMAISLHGGRRLALGDVPPLGDGEAEAFTFRPAGEDDLGFVTERFAEAADRYLVSCKRDAAAWRLELQGRSEGGAAARVVEIVQRSGAPVGVVVAWEPLQRTRHYVMGAEVVEGVSWGELGPALFRHLAAAAPQKATALAFHLGDEHPLYEAMSHVLNGRSRPYAWYARVPDIPAFLDHVSPVLEWRVGESAFDGHTGDLKVSWFEGGVRLSLGGGLLTVEEWAPDGHDDGDLGFPGLTFLSLVFGRRSFRELRDAHPDCVVYTPAAVPLIEAVFPPRPSWVYGID